MLWWWPWGKPPTVPHSAPTRSQDGVRRGTELNVFSSSCSCRDINLGAVYYDQPWHGLRPRYPYQGSYKNLRGKGYTLARQLQNVDRRSQFPWTWKSAQLMQVNFELSSVKVNAWFSKLTFRLSFFLTFILSKYQVAKARRRKRHLCQACDWTWHWMATTTTISCQCSQWAMLCPLRPSTAKLSSCWMPKAFPFWNAPRPKVSPQLCMVGNQRFILRDWSLSPLFFFSSLFSVLCIVLMVVSINDRQQRAWTWSCAHSVDTTDCMMWHVRWCVGACVHACVYVCARVCTCVWLSGKSGNKAICASALGRAKGERDITVDRVHTAVQSSSLILQYYMF